MYMVNVSVVSTLNLCTNSRQGDTNYIKKILILLIFSTLKKKEESIPNPNMLVFTYLIVATLIDFTVISECADYWHMPKLRTFTRHMDHFSFFVWNLYYIYFKSCRLIISKKFTQRVKLFSSLWGISLDIRYIWEFWFNHDQTITPATPPKVIA